MIQAAVPQRIQRVLTARWLFAAVILVVGAISAVVAERTWDPGLTIGLLTVACNTVLLFASGRGDERDGRLILPQLILDSLITVAAIHYGRVLTPAVQFYFLFPLFTATLLAPREGLFLTAAVCGVLYATSELLAVHGWWPPDASQAASDPTLGALAATGMVVGALLAAASILSYLVRTLAAIEHDLARSEANYRRLAGSLEVEVRQRTRDLRGALDELHGRNRELLRLHQVDSAIQASQEVGCVLQSVVDGVAEILPDAQAAILLTDPALPGLRVARVSSNAERRAAAVELLLGRPLDQVLIPLREGTLAEYVWRTRELTISHDFDRVLAGGPASPERRELVGAVSRILKVKSCVVLPLLVADELIGLLAVGSRRRLEADGLGPVKGFATRAALALDRAQREQHLRQSQADLQAAYDELRASQEQVVLLEKMRAVAEMTSGVAHNFNNALTAILGSVQLLLKDEQNPASRRRLELIEKTANDAAKLVLRIRAFTRNEPPSTRAVDPNRLVQDVVAMTEPRWRHAAERVEAPIQVKTETLARQLVEAEESAIREVLINLIWNAIKALPRGGQIDLRTWDDRDQVFVSVRDNGCGMTEEIRQRCFEPFYTTDQEQGTGLGLSVAYGIIQRHRGVIQVKSAPGVGTEFLIVLPALAANPATANTETAPAVAAPVVAAVPAVAVAPASGPAAVHALVVDDQQIVRQTLAEMLEALGHRVTMVSSGPEALDEFDPGVHQVVVTDWGMPGMSGLAVAKAIKDRSAATPVVLVTGFDSNLPEEVRQAKEIDFRLHKPVDLQELARAIEQVTAYAEV